MAFLGYAIKIRSVIGLGEEEVSSVTHLPASLIKHKIPYPDRTLHYWNVDVPYFSQIH